MSSLKYFQIAFELILHIFIAFKCAESSLLYPQFTVLQLVGSLSVPIADLPTDRKVFFDWGLQMNYDMPFNVSSFYMVPIWATNGTSRMTKWDFLARAVHQNDFTAKQLYKGFENMLESYGYDRSCLKRSICDLSQHSFDSAYKNIVSDVIEFLLTPSKHKGFSTNEYLDEAAYKLAEDQGIMGKNCQDLYPQCTKNLFDILTGVDLMKF